MTLAQIILERIKEHLSLLWPENVSPANAASCATRPISTLGWPR